MHVFPIGSYTNQESVKHNTNFKQGLTSEIVEHVKNMDKEEYRNITERVWKKYGIIAHVGTSNAVAFCLEKTADIISKAGFKLPKVFLFEKLDDGYYGEYNDQNCVCINSDREEFLDLEQQNSMEESIRSGEPFKHHFLDTYIHEFMHSAHCENIIEKHGGKEGKEIFFGDMARIKPYDVIKQPLKEFIKKLFPNDYINILITVFTDYGGLFKTDDLSEYFTEKNTVVVSEKLGDDFNIDNITTDISSGFKGFPKNWNLENQEKAIKKLKLKYELNKLIGIVSLYKNAEDQNKLEEKLIKIFSDYISFTEGEIWNGNVDKILTNIKNLNIDSCKK